MLLLISYSLNYYQVWWILSSLKEMRNKDNNSVKKIIGDGKDKKQRKSIKYSRAIRLLLKWIYCICSLKLINRQKKIRDYKVGHWKWVRISFKINSIFWCGNPHILSKQKWLKKHFFWCGNLSETIFVFFSNTNILYWLH